MAGHDALAVLKTDHDKVKELLAQFDELGDGAVKVKGELVAQICHELTIHVTLEEEIPTRPSGREGGGGGGGGAGAVLQHAQGHR